MHAAYYAAFLPWDRTPEDDERLRKLLLWILLTFILLSIILPWLPLPEKEEKEVVEVPPRLARIIEERKQLPPAPPAPKAEQVKPQAKAEAKPKPKKQPKPKAESKQAKKPTPTTKQTAREKAMSSGLLALADDLAELRENPSVKNLGSKTLQKGSGQAKTVDRSMVTAGVGQGSGGISTGGLSRNTGGSGLGGRSTTKVSGPKSTAGGGGGGSRKSGGGRKGSRTEESIQIVFDRNKSALHSIYNRGLRANPSLQGKVVFSLTIEPSGRVTACRIISSELGDPALERKLVQRVKLLKFGAADVVTETFNYPITFFPA